MIPENRMGEKINFMSSVEAKKCETLDFESALSKTIERHPELAEDIKKSLEVPQLSEYHTEGPTLESHLKLMIENLNSIKEGKFPPDIDEETKKIIENVVVVNGKINPVLVDYVFFHDLAKTNSLLIKTEGAPKGLEISWEDWKAKGTKDNYDGNKISSISYFHPSQGPIGTHGNKAVKMLRDKGILPDLLTAISKHEIAYQFGKINTATFEEHFVKPGFSNELQNLILVASYIDQVSSLRPDGKPNLKSFLNLLHSQKNYQMIKEYIDKGIQFRENDLNALKKLDRKITSEDVKKNIVKEKNYDFEKMRTELDKLHEVGQLDSSDVDLIISTLQTTPKELGKKLGPKMRFIKFVLDQCII